MAGFATGLRRGARPSLINGDTRTPEEFEADSNAAAAAAYGDFGGGLASAVRGAVGATKSYAAAGLDAAGLREASQRTYEAAAIDNARAQAIAPEIATTDQIVDPATAARYALGKVGGAAGSLPLGLAGGVAGRLLTRSGAGALAGASAAYQPVMAGGHIQDLNANANTAGMDPDEKFLRGTAVGTGQAVLEGAVPGYFANRLGKRLPSASTVRGRFKDTAREAIGGAAAEGGFAAGSDVIGQGALIQADPNVKYDARQTFEAGVGEAIGGVGITAPAATLNTGLDYLATRSKQAGKLVSGTADTVAGKAPAAGAALRTVADAGALFKNTAAGYIDNPEMSKLLAAQELPPELDGANQGEILDWMAQDTGQRHQAALSIAQRMVADPNTSDASRAEAQALLDNPSDPESWKPFASSMIAKHQIDRLGNKFGQARSQLSGWIEKTRGKMKSNLESTAQDAEFAEFMREPLSQALGVTDEASVDDATALLNDYVLEDFASDADGQPRLPEGLVDALGDQAPALIETTYDTLRRQGRTLKLDATAKDKLAAVKQLVSKQLTARDTAAGAVEQQLTPTMLRQVPKDALLDIASGIRDYLRNRDRNSTEYNLAVETQLDQMFGPNKEALLEQLAALDKPLKAQSFADLEKPANPDSIESDDAGSDAADDDFESGLQEVAPALNYHFKGDKGKAPFDVDDPFLKRNLDLAIARVDPSQVASQLNKNTLKTEARMDKVGVVDYAKATGDNSVVDGLNTKYPGVSLDALNNRFFVLSTQDVGIDESDPIDIKPLELVRPATRNGNPNKASWQDVTRIDSKKGNIDTSTIAHGRIYFTPGTPGRINKETGEVIPATKQGKEFITSAQKLITKMWEKKKQGAFDDRTAEKTGADDMLAMFAAGISSLQATGKFHGEMQIKMPDGKMQVVNGSDFPNEFVLYQGKNFKVTVGDARGATSKKARAYKQSFVQFDEQGKEVTPPKPSETFETSDIPSMTVSELRDEYASVRVSIENLNKRIAESKNETKREQMREKRNGLEIKLDKLEAAGAKRTSDRQPTEGEIAAKETAGAIGSRTVTRQEDGKLRGARTEHHGITESDEIAAAAQTKEDAKPRVYDEETGLELHPKEIMSADKRARLLGTQVKSKLTMPMNYKDGQVVNGKTLHMREEFRGKSTMDLILSGDRTATTGSLHRFEDLKEGDVFTVSGNGKSALVRVTKAPYPVARMSPDAWSALEGWAPAVREQYARAYQMQYELVKEPGANPTESKPISSRAKEAAAEQKRKEGKVKHNLESTALHESLSKRGFAATHDSPIKHEGKFDWRAHIGKGEGNAAFGAGTYLSTADRVHRSYKRMFTAKINPNSILGEPEWAAMRIEYLEDVIKELLPYAGRKVLFVDNNKKGSQVIDPSNELYSVYERTGGKHINVDVELAKIKAALAEMRAPVKPSPTYQVSVNIEQDGLMDWDAPLSEQSELVRKALKEAGINETTDAVSWEKEGGEHVAYFEDGSLLTLRSADGGWKFDIDGANYGVYRDFSEAKAAANKYARENMSERMAGLVSEHQTGDELYRDLTARLGSQAKASDYLQSLGILGHKYNAAGGKEGKFPNYVIYDDSKIETNFVQFSLEDPAGNKPITAEQRAEVEAYIEKTLGKDVAKIFTSQLKGSGEWSRDADNQKATIKIATTALNPLSVAHHEAMHEFFQRLMDGKHEQSAKVLTNAASSPIVRRAMERIFASNPQVLKQIETDPEERVAYMFQLWAAGKITVGPQTETVFRKIVNTIRRVLGLMSEQQRATAILEAFHDGKFAEPSAMAEILGTEEARGAWLKNVGGKTKPVLDRAGEWVGFAENALTGSENPHLDAIGRLFHNKTGSRGDAQGFLSAKEQANNKYMNKFANALRGVDPTGKDKRVAAKEDVELALTGLQTKEFHADPVIRRVQDQVIAVFKEMYGYLEEAGVKRLDEKTHKWVPIRKIDDYRIPVSWDPAKIISNSKQFKELLFKHHEAELAGIAEKANKEVVTGKEAAVYTAAWEQLKNPISKPITAEDIANAIVNRLINSNGQTEVKESENALGFSPFMKSVNERTLDWIDQSVFHEFQEKDIVRIISSYVGQATKRAEYSRRFGADGSILEEKMKAAWEFEKDKIKEKGAEGDIELEALQQLEPARRAVMAMEGTLGHDISVALRTASAYTIVYQNVRLLGYALFSNVVDPLGIIVRGGEAKDAFAAFKRGIQGVVRDWGDLSGVRKAKDSDYDEATRVAEMIGTVDSAGFMSQMGTMYGSQYLPEWAKKVNDNFFRWNGLEAFNKAMRVQATQAAISFIKRHYEKPNEHSDRYFTELGLSRDDVVIGKDGTLNVDNRQVQQAVMRWVDGAILRPNAAIRPTMSSDPHFAVFYHLKQFMYAMHAIILKRVQVEIQNGNTDPLLLLMAGYVPVMLAADAAKGLIQVATGGGAPVWQHEGVAGVVSHGVQRAGLLGVGQMIPDALAHGPIELAGPAVGQVADAVVEPLPQTVAEATMLGPLNMALKGVSWGDSSVE